MDLQIVPKTVQQQTVERLREAIIAGVFVPGERLSEARLCSLLGISRPSVREALRSLEASKLVVIVPNKGPHIPILDREQLLDLYAVRTMLEGEACSLCAMRRSENDITIMRRALERFKSETETAGRVAATEEFYNRVLLTCGNKLIRELLQSLHDRVNLQRAQSMSNPGRSVQSHDEMCTILDAIERRDAAAAREAAIYHVRQAEKATLQKLKSSVEAETTSLVRQQDLQE